MEYVSLEFNGDKYREAALLGNCDPPGVFTPFINVDLLRLDRLRNTSDPFDIDALRERFGRNMFNKVRGALDLTLRHSMQFFPAYQCLMNDISNDEWLAAADGRSYHRDHIIHHPMSVYVGLSLLQGRDLSGAAPGSMTFSGKSLLDHCVDMMTISPKCKYLRDYYKKMCGDSLIFDNDFPYSQTLRKWLFLETFFLATLFHDIGYPWNFVTKVHDKLKTLSPIENPITQNSNKIARHYYDRLVLYPLRGYNGRDIMEPDYWPEDFTKLVNESITRTHGLPGAIALLYLNDVVRKYPLDDNDRPARRFCIEWAAMAVMMHDMAGIYASIDDDGNKNYPHLRLSLSRDPLSFMLTLTDQLQEFDRPDATFRGDDDSAVVTYGSRCKNVQVRWNEDTGLFKIIYEYERDSDYYKNRDRYLPERELLYFDPVEGYLDFSDIGIREVQLEAALTAET